MDIVNKTIQEYIQGLSREEKEELLEQLIKVLDLELIDLVREIDDLDVCPRCKSNNTIKKGKPKDRQRWFCQCCKKSFSASTNRILSYSKLPGEVWVAFARLMIDGMSLRECTFRCGVCLKTAFFMRHRILECMNKYIDLFRVDSSCSAEIDEFYLRESFKGNHTKSTVFVMPREPKRRSGDYVTGGTTKDLICILTGINDRGGLFLEVAGMGRFESEDASRMLREKIYKGAIISTDGHQSYVKIMQEIEVAVHNRFSTNNRSRGVINAVNGLHSRLDAFLQPFRGISSRWVENYLSWFKWLESFRMRNSKEKAEKAIAHISNGFYKLRVRDYWKLPYQSEIYLGV